MRPNNPVSKTTIKVLYSAAGVFLVIGIYMYVIGTETSKAGIPNAGNKSSLPNSLKGNSVIILALVAALTLQF